MLDDDFWRSLGIDPNSPAVLAAVEESRSQPKARCNYGQCTVWLHNGKAESSAGPMTCPCDNTRGWNRGRLAEMGKPHPPVKAVGRHAGRVERRRKEVRGFRLWLRDAEEILGQKESTATGEQGL